jgi:hypothetical protein
MIVLIIISTWLLIYNLKTPKKLKDLLKAYIIVGEMTKWIYDEFIHIIYK